LHEEKRLDQGNMEEKDYMDLKKRIGRVKKGGNQIVKRKMKNRKVEDTDAISKEKWKYAGIQERNDLVNRGDLKVSGNYRGLSF